MIQTKGLRKGHNHRQFSSETVATAKNNVPLMFFLLYVGFFYTYLSVGLINTLIILSMNIVSQDVVVVFLT